MYSRSVLMPPPPNVLSPASIPLQFCCLYEPFRTTGTSASHPYDMQSSCVSLRVFDLHATTKPQRATIGSFRLPSLLAYALCCLCPIRVPSSSSFGFVVYCGDLGAVRKLKACHIDSAV